MARKPKKPQEPEKPAAATEHAALDIDKRNQKASLRLLQRAVTAGWKIPDAVMEQAPDICARILNDDLSQSRDRLRAAEVLAAMMRDKVTAAIALDKMERLEDGEATDRVEISPAIQARAREIIAKRLGASDRPGN